MDRLKDLKLSVRVMQSKNSGRRLRSANGGRATSDPSIFRIFCITRVFQSSLPIHSTQTHPPISIPRIWLSPPSYRLCLRFLCSLSFKVGVPEAAAVAFSLFPSPLFIAGPPTGAVPSLYAPSPISPLSFPSCAVLSFPSLSFFVPTLLQLKRSLLGLREEFSSFILFFFFSSQIVIWGFLKST